MCQGLDIPNTVFLQVMIALRLVTELNRMVNFNAPNTLGEVDQSVLSHLDAKMSKGHGVLRNMTSLVQWG